MDATEMKMPATRGREIRRMVADMKRAIISPYALLTRAGCLTGEELRRKKSGTQLHALSAFGQKSPLGQGGGSRPPYADAVERVSTRLSRLERRKS
jgi:hypothetical protein